MIILCWYGIYLMRLFRTKIPVLTELLVTWNTHTNSVIIFERQNILVFLQLFREKKTGIPLSINIAWSFYVGLHISYFWIICSSLILSIKINIKVYFIQPITARCCFYIPPENILKVFCFFWFFRVLYKPNTGL